MLCVTRQPVKTCTEPSSIVVGIETSTAFLHWPRTPTRSSSIPKTSATFLELLLRDRERARGAVTKASLYPEANLALVGGPGSVG